MSLPFSSRSVAAGYARCRPPVHPGVVELALAALNAAGRRFHRALDIGCGAGLSTAPLLPVAESVTGIDPAEAMLAWAVQVVPQAHWVQSTAESLPFSAGAFDLITAAGSLNYSGVEHSLAEAARVLAPAGVLLVYDFSPGRSFGNSAALDDWFESFITRYPPAPDEGRVLDPQILAGLAPGLRIAAHNGFEIALPMRAESYTDYALTETNVAYAMRCGHSPGSLRAWCSDGIRNVFAGRIREVLFRGYFACFVPAD
jgi:SAM-dependent methyltransferase